jgi:hypothetical protein
MERVLMRQHLSIFAVLFSALALTGCSGDGIAGPANRRIARADGVNTTPIANLVGTWRREVFFLDEFNFARSTETTFQFNGDSSVVRLQVARNFTLGLVDAQVSTGRWTVSGEDLVIDFLTPSAFRLTLETSLVGDQLVLSGETYLRVLN